MIEKDQLKLLMRARPYSLAAMTLAAGLLYILLLSNVGGVELHLWFSMILLVDSFRFYTIFSYKKDKQKNTIDVQKNVRMLCIGTVVSGFLWGSAGLIFFPEASMHEKMFIFGTMLAVATGSTLNTYLMYRMTAIFILMVLLPLIAGVYISEAFAGTDTLIIICMVSIYLMYLLKKKMLVNFKRIF